MSDTYQMTFEGSPLIWRHWFWLITDEPETVFSAADNDKIGIDDARYTDWLASHSRHVARQVETAADLYNDIWPLNRQVAYQLPIFARQENQGEPSGGPDVIQDGELQAASAMFNALVVLLEKNPEMRDQLRQVLDVQ